MLCSVRILSLSVHSMPVSEPPVPSVHGPRKKTSSTTVHTLQDARRGKCFHFRCKPNFPFGWPYAKVVGSTPVFRYSCIQDSLQVAQMSPLQSFPPEAGRTNRGMFPEYFLPTIRDQPGLLGWSWNMHNCDHLSCALRIKIKLNWVSISWCMCPLTCNSFGFI